MAGRVTVPVKSICLASREQHQLGWHRTGGGQADLFLVECVIRGKAV